MTSIIDQFITDVIEPIICIVIVITAPLVMLSCIKYLLFG